MDERRNILTLARGLLLEARSVRQLIGAIAACEDSERRDRLMKVLVSHCTCIVCDWVDANPSQANLAVFEALGAMLKNPAANYRWFGLGDFEPSKNQSTHE